MLTKISKSLNPVSFNVILIWRHGRVLAKFRELSSRGPFNGKEKLHTLCKRGGVFKHVFLIFILFSLTPNLGLSQDLEAIQAFLRSQQIIRVIVTNSPGLGHQAASANIIDRIRELGFTGEIQVLYDLQMLTTLRRVLPSPYLHGGVEEFDPILNIRYVRFPFPELGPNADAASNSNVPEIVRSQRVPFAITGGDDRKNRPEAVNSDYILRVWPQHWANVTILGRSPSLRLMLRDSRDLPLALRLTFSARWPQFINEQYAQVGASEGQRNSLIALTDGNFDLVPYYGNHYGAERSSIRTIVDYARALQAARMRLPGEASRPGIVCVFNPLDPTQAAGLMDSLAALPSSPAIQFIDARDASAPRQLRALHPTDVAVVLVTPVPRHVFERIYFESRWPGVVEGRNSADLAKQVARGQGTPFMVSKRTEFYSFLNYREDLMFQYSGQFREATPNFASMDDGLLLEIAAYFFSTGREYPWLSDALAEFMIRSRPGGSMRAYFAKRLAAEPAQDRLLAGLDILRQWVGPGVRAYYDGIDEVLYPVTGLRQTVFESVIGNTDMVSLGHPSGARGRFAPFATTQSAEMLPELCAIAFSGLRRFLGFAY